MEVAPSKALEAALSIVVVPLEKISDHALEGLISEFILREGTDYGKHEYSLEQKHEQIKKQLNSKQVVVVFDAFEQSCSITRKESLPKELRQDLDND